MEPLLNYLRCLQDVGKGREQERKLCLQDVGKGREQERKRLY